MNLHWACHSYLRWRRVLALTVPVWLALVLPALGSREVHIGQLLALQNGNMVDVNDPNQGPMPAQPFALIVLRDEMGHLPDPGQLPLPA